MRKAHMISETEPVCTGPTKECCIFCGIYYDLQQCFYGIPKFGNEWVFYSCPFFLDSFPPVCLFCPIPMCSVFPFILLCFIYIPQDPVCFLVRNKRESSWRWLGKIRGRKHHNINTLYEKIAVFNKWREFILLKTRKKREFRTRNIF